MANPSSSTGATPPSESPPSTTLPLPLTASPTSIPSTSLPNNVNTESTTSSMIASPSSPTTSSSNRFGLALNFIQRRPRGLTNPLKPSTSGSTSPGGSGGGGNFFGAGGIGSGSPSSELPPSPNSGGGERSYGFPALRRTLSKKPNNSGSTSPPISSTSTTTPATAIAEVSNRSATRTSRSSSQPPQAPSVGVVDRIVASTSTRPHTATSLPPTSITTNGTTDPTSPPSPGSTPHRLRLVPHLESARSLHFDPLDRELPPFVVLKVGRFTDRSTLANTTSDPRRIAFKSKVVSRGHAEVWCDDSGKFFIKDTKSSSGTFLNHIRLSGPGAESRPFPLKDGDILQLGVDYQGGTEEIYRCVKMKVELNRGWQRAMNSFNTNALAQLRALGGGSNGDTTTVKTLAAQKAAQSNSVTDCCICLFPVTVCQALFIAPCSHVTHFKCIRPLVDANYPGFSCPSCRTYSDLEADVEIEPWEMEEPAPIEEEEESTEVIPVAETVEANGDIVMEEANPIVSRPNSVLHSKNGHSKRSSVVPLEGDTMKGSPSTSSLRRTSITPATTIDPVPSSSSSIPIAIGSPSLNFSAETQAALYASTSLADAATPPNNTFLSTLADSIPNHGSYHHPSLDQACTRLSLNGTAGPSKSTPLSRVHSSSEDDEEEDETDGNSKEGEENGVVSKGKGKEKWTAGDEIPVDDLMAEEV